MQAGTVTTLKLMVKSRRTSLKMEACDQGAREFPLFRGGRGSINCGSQMLSQKKSHRLVALFVAFYVANWVINPKPAIHSVQTMAQRFVGPVTPGQSVRA